MKRIATLLIIPISVAMAQTPERPLIVQEQQGNVTNVRIEGSLAPTQDLQCLSMADVKASYTPPDLHTGIAKCMAKNEYDKAARLFLLAGIYSRFDAERIADQTVRGGSQVLIMKAFANYTKDQKEAFSKAAKQLFQNETELRGFCSQLVQIGPPTYFPKYLVLHGMNAFTSANPLEHALIPDFDAAGTWSRLQGTYAHCPK